MVKKYVNKNLDEFSEVVKTIIDVIKQLSVSPCIQCSENQFCDKRQIAMPPQQEVVLICKIM